MNEQTDVAVVQPPPQAVTLATENAHGITPAQARIESVAAVLDAAYRNASTLTLTPEESQALAEDFPDEAFSLGAGGDANLVYIEHAYLRQRLNKVLGIGAVVPIRRREWAEDEGKAVRVYVDMVLVVRGCLVAETVADGVYWKTNSKTTYSDALEGAMSNAFRRLCKQFGIGLQAWMKGWCEGWKERQRQANRDRQQQEFEPRRQNSVETMVSKPVSQQTNIPAKATEKTRDWMLGNLKQFSEADLGVFASHKGWLRIVDSLTNWPLEQVPMSRQALGDLIREIEQFIAARAPQQDLPFSEPFWDAVITVPRAGMKRVDYMNNVDTIRSLYEAAKSGDDKARVRLYGLAKEWEPQEWTGNDGALRPPSEADTQCRKALDQFLEWSDARHER